MQYMRMFDGEKEKDKLKTFQMQDLIHLVELQLLPHLRLCLDFIIFPVISNFSSKEISIL